MTTTVLACAPECIGMASMLVGDAFASSRIVGGRGYVLVRGDIGPALSFIDPTDDTLLLEANTFRTTEAADAWIAADVAERARPA